jgi:predicted GIY-YIG superfamily endonuclease
MSAVYILHFDHPLKHAAHYVGWANDVSARLAHHRNGTGARLCQVLNELGIGYELARVFEGKDKTFERKLKNTNHTARYCPMCQAKPRDYHPTEER